MNRQIRAISPISILVKSAGFFFLGILILSNPALVNRSLLLIVRLALLGAGVLSIGGFLFARGKRKPSSLLAGVAMILGAAIIESTPRLALVSLSFSIGLLALIEGLAQFLYFAQLRATRSGAGWWYLFIGILFTLFGAALMTKPLERYLRLNELAGIWCILYGCSSLVEFVIELLRWDESGRIKTRLRVQPPVILTAFLPTRLLNRVNAMVETESGDLTLSKKALREGETCLKVLFHLGKNAAYGMGHVDISYKGVAYSYGCYDETSNRLLGLISDGSFLVAPEDGYLAYCRLEERKRLIGFSLCLSAQEQKKVSQALEHILSGCEIWRPTEKNAAARRARDEVGARFFKVKAGRFRYYNALSTNCVAMAEMLVNETGVAILPRSGIITPGSYYAFMHRQFELPKTRVVNETVYRELDGEAGEAAPEKA